ncbi:hypothetical protein, variant [Aphanomyces invadans]|uniref:EF-hand domain-containing protein n=2 Tax=Aphanomyces invadans TaxID=157072 RepID=A0A024TLJ3_9STRA|nr:hypothetical protein, variant [Aphanomyces invadans]ETV94486.1 hypothetical protein, variant [Aphanomyces invadans]|eukprot:XP_008876801.1 hypothetical protein, variant [Aphanomyces invadans]
MMRPHSNYIALGSPSNKPSEGASQTPPTRVFCPVPGGHSNKTGSSEVWDAAKLVPQLTVDEAQNLEWNYGHVLTRHRSVKGTIESPSRTYDDDVEAEELKVLLDPYYDVTTGRLRRMYQHFNPRASAGVNYDEFEKGLFALGITPPPGMDFGQFTRKVDADGDGMVSLAEFVAVVQMIKQAHLFKPEHSHQDSTARSALRVVDYSPTHVHAVDPVRHVQGFMFSAKPAWATVRWVHLAGFQRMDDLNVRRLAIKYQLHPLAVEDCLSADDKIRCKYEHYDDHSFLIVPVLRPLDVSKRSHLEACINDRRRALFHKDRTLRKGGALDNTRASSMLSFFKPTTPTVAAKSSPHGGGRPSSRHHKRLELESKLDKLHVLMRQPQQLCVFVSKDKAHVLSIQEEEEAGAPTETTARPLWHVIYDRNLTKSYSKLRNHDATFLVVSILAATVDEMMPLVAVFESTLKMLGKLLRLEGIQFNPKRLARAQKHLVGLEKVVRPMLDLVQDQLLDQDEFRHGEVKNYLRDVMDHLRQMAVDIRDHHQTLAALVDEDKQLRAQHKDDVMYAMSVVAACFLPGTFMTGIYGMNFENIPELKLEYGYYVWWAVLCVIVALLLVYLKVIKKWI